MDLLNIYKYLEKTNYKEFLQIINDKNLFYKFIETINTNFKEFNVLKMELITKLILNKITTFEGNVDNESFQIFYENLKNKNDLNFILLNSFIEKFDIYKEIKLNFLSLNFQLIKIFKEQFNDLEIYHGKNIINKEDINNIKNIIDDQVIIYYNAFFEVNYNKYFFKRIIDAKLLSNVSFDEAIELAFFGAKVIHPKTIQPLKKKGITLRIKSFINEKLPGTIIEELTTTNYDFASYIIKEKQILISISDRDLSFIVENHISQIFDLLATHYISVNMMQNSAVSFSICVDNDKYKIPKLINELQQYFKVAYNEGVSLYTIRNYKEEDIQSLTDNKKIILQQKSRNTLQFIALV